MDAYDLLPVNNFQYGKHPDTHKIDSQVWTNGSRRAFPISAGTVRMRAPRPPMAIT